MDKTALSSNWKKLQATLKKDSTTKRKPSDTGDGTVKKRKLTEKQKPYTRDTKPLKRKRMSEKTETADAAPAETSSRYKENEGRSAT